MKISSAVFVKSGVRVADYPDDNLPEVAFAGRSNVGKSSLLNSLMQRRNLVKVSSTPGRTQLLNWFKVNESMMVCDLPGYGFAKVPGQMRQGWAEMINTYLTERSNLLALAILVDVRRGFEEDDMMLVEAAGRLGLQPILVMTKCDKLKPNALYSQKQKIAKQMKADVKKDFVWTSAVDNTGREELWGRIMRLLPSSAGGA